MVVVVVGWDILCEACVEGGSTASVAAEDDGRWGDGLEDCGDGVGGHVVGVVGVVVGGWLVVCWCCVYVVGANDGES